VAGHTLRTGNLAASRRGRTLPLTCCNSQRCILPQLRLAQ